MLISKEAIFNMKIGAKGEQLRFLQQVEVLIGLYKEDYFVNELNKSISKLNSLVELEKRADPHRKAEVTAEINKIKKTIKNLNFILCK